MMIGIVIIHILKKVNTIEIEVQENTAMNGVEGEAGAGVEAGVEAEKVENKKPFDVTQK
jgi:hypothetical protein